MVAVAACAANCSILLCESEVVGLGTAVGLVDFAGSSGCGGSCDGIDPVDLLSPRAVGVRRSADWAVGGVACWNFADELEGNALSLPHVRFVDLAVVATTESLPSNIDTKKAAQE